MALKKRMARQRKHQPHQIRTNPHRFDSSGQQVPATPYSVGIWRGEDCLKKCCPELGTLEAMRLAKVAAAAAVDAAAAAVDAAAAAAANSSSQQQQQKYGSYVSKREASPRSTRRRMCGSGSLTASRSSCPSTQLVSTDTRPLGCGIDSAASSSVSSRTM